MFVRPLERKLNLNPLRRSTLSHCGAGLHLLSWGARKADFLSAAFGVWRVCVPAAAFQRRLWAKFALCVHLWRLYFCWPVVGVLAAGCCLRVAQLACTGPSWPNNKTHTRQRPSVVGRAKKQRLCSKTKRHSIIAPLGPARPVKRRNCRPFFTRQTRQTGKVEKLGVSERRRRRRRRNSNRPAPKGQLLSDFRLPLRWWLANAAAFYENPKPSKIISKAMLVH